MRTKAFNRQCFAASDYLFLLVINFNSNFFFDGLDFRHISGKASFDGPLICWVCPGGREIEKQQFNIGCTEGTFSFKKQLSMPWSMQVSSSISFFLG